MEDPSADILEIRIDALGTELVENGAIVALGPMIEAGVVAGLAHCPYALVLVAGAAHDSGSGKLGELARDLTDGARRGGHERRFAGFGPADMLHAVPGREARHAEHTEIGRRRRDARIDLAQALAVVNGAG